MLIKNIIYCFDSVYKYFEDYINSISSKIECSVYKYTENNLHIDPEINYIFIQTLPKFILDSNRSYNNIFLVNTEQMTRRYDDWYDKINSLPTFIKIIDYSFENTKYYINHICYYVPYQVNYKEIYNLQKDKGICIISDNNMPAYRQNIVNQVRNRGYEVTICSGWGEVRDKELFRHKILINMGYDTSCKIMEQIRCNRCILNKMIVVSETKIDTDYIFAKNVVFSEYSTLADKIIEVYDNYDRYYNELFSNFDDNIPIIDNIQKSYLSIFA